MKIYPVPTSGTDVNFVVKAESLSEVVILRHFVQSCVPDDLWIHSYGGSIDRSSHDWSFCFGKRPTPKAKPWWRFW